MDEPAELAGGGSRIAANPEAIGLYQASTPVRHIDKVALNNEPIFLVGIPRSGTTLLAAILGSHSRIGAGPETHFFLALSRKDLARSIADANWPGVAVQMVTSLKLEGQPVASLHGVTAAEVKSYLSEHRPSVRAMLESLTLVHASKLGKRRWLEKTPNHLLRLSQIRQEFPASPIIRIVRDPRDCALSLAAMPWESNSLLANSYMIRKRLERAQHFFDVDHNSVTVMYEALIADPVNEVKRLCTFLGEEFQESMLDTKNAGRLVGSPNEPWKAKAQRPIDASRAFAWKRQLTDIEALVSTCICLPVIERFDYQVLPGCKDELAAFPLFREYIEANEEQIYDWMRRGVTLVETGSPRRARRLALLYAPSRKMTTVERMLRLSKYLALAIGFRFLRRQVFFMAPDSKTSVSIFNRILVWLLRKCTNKPQSYGA